jgi:hypothetical protein
MSINKMSDIINNNIIIINKMSDIINNNDNDDISSICSDDDISSICSNDDYLCDISSVCSDKSDKHGLFCRIVNKTNNTQIMDNIIKDFENDDEKELLNCCYDDSDYYLSFGENDYNNKIENEINSYQKINNSNIYKYYCIYFLVTCIICLFIYKKIQLK